MKRPYEPFNSADIPRKSSMRLVRGLAARACRSFVAYYIFLISSRSISGMHLSRKIWRVYRWSLRSGDNTIRQLATRRRTTASVFPRRYTETFSNRDYRVGFTSTLNIGLIAPWFRLIRSYTMHSAISSQKIGIITYYVTHLTVAQLVNYNSNAEQYVEHWHYLASDDAILENAQSIDYESYIHIPVILEDWSVAAMTRYLYRHKVSYYILFLLPSFDDINTSSYRRARKYF